MGLMHAPLEQKPQSRACSLLPCPPLLVLSEPLGRCLVGMTCGQLTVPLVFCAGRAWLQRTPGE